MIIAGTFAILCAIIKEESQAPSLERFIFMAKKILTKETHKQLLAELEQRKFSVRKEIAERMRESKEFGDLSENASYKETKEQESFNEARIEQLEEIIREAEIIEGPHKKDIVEIGDQVELDSGLQFELVDSQQAKPPTKISIESPLGKAVFGKKVGESFSVKMPNNSTQTFRVTKIIE